VYRKFAFKAEHTNMRTYHFAADNRDLMVQWMNALSLASILQEGSRYSNDSDSNSSSSSSSSTAAAVVAVEVMTNRLDIIINPLKPKIV
jgi:hypothetical protein